MSNNEIKKYVVFTPCGKKKPPLNNIIKGKIKVNTSLYISSTAFFFQFKCFQIESCTLTCGIFVAFCLNPPPPLKIFIYFASYSNFISTFPQPTVSTTSLKGLYATIHSYYNSTSTFLASRRKCMLGLCYTRLFEEVQIHQLKWNRYLHNWKRLSTFSSSTFLIIFRKLYNIDQHALHLGILHLFPHYHQFLCSLMMMDFLQGFLW